MKLIHVGCSAVCFGFQRGVYDDDSEEKTRKGLEWFFSLVYSNFFQGLSLTWLSQAKVIFF